MEEEKPCHCSVFGCEIRKGNPHRFPSPKLGLDRFRKWVAAANNPSYKLLTDRQIHKRGFVCRAHFTSEDYEETGKLCKTAIPSENLPSKPHEPALGLPIDVEAFSPTQVNLEGRLFQKWASAEGSTSEFRKSPVAGGSRGEEVEGGSRGKVATGDLMASVQAVTQPRTELMEPSTSKRLDRPEKQKRLREPSPSKTKFPGAKRRMIDRLGGAGQALKEVVKDNVKPHVQALYREAQKLQKKVARLQRLHKCKVASFAAAKRLSKNEKLRELIEGMTPIQRRFFESQLRNVHRKPQGRSFTFEEKADAISIWKSSPKTYKLLSAMFAMPSLGTLQATLQMIPVEPGISKPTFEVLKRRVRRMRDARHKMCVLLFDEIAVQPHLDYLPHEDRLVGFEDDGSTRSNEIADHVCVFMLRGIFKKWKQPVAFVFCKGSMAPANIVRFFKGIVREATAAGLNIIASVCDHGTTNVAAIDMLLEETRRNASLKGEEVRVNVITIDNHTVIPLFDPPHLLKSMRNNLLTKKLRFFHDNEEKVADWQHVQEAYQRDQSMPAPFRVWRKLTLDHVNPVGNKKMRVKLAAQVFSQHVGTTLHTTLHYEGRPVSGNPKHTADLCRFLNSVFDSVNGGFESAPETPLRQKVRRKSSHHKYWLEGKRMFSEMRFIPSKPRDRPRPPVLDGWCRTLGGFILIKETLRKLGCRFFPARAFNQDPLENFFGQIQQHGGRYNNPTCSAFVPYYKSLLIRSFSSYHCRGSNCEKEINPPLVTLRDFLSQERTNRSLDTSTNS